MNGAFSAGPDPGPALLTDGQQMAFCVQRERKRGRRGKGEKKRYSEKEGRGVLRFFRTLQSEALYAGLKCLIT